MRPVDREPATHSRAEVLRRAAALALGVAAARSGLGGLLEAGEARAAVPAPRPTLTRLDLPLAARSGTAGATAIPTSPFTLVGMHWQGPGSVSFRTRGAAGTWSAWQVAVEHERANAAEGAATRGWRLGTPAWTGAADGIEYRTSGVVTGLRAHLVDSTADGRPTQARVAKPAIILRADWGADESIVRSEPSYAPHLLLSVVHHTAGSSPATPDDSAAVVRGIQTYHVEGNGWNDIGYNFLVDPFGQVFEGRGGGVARNVIGAHALGFNTGSTGVALLGNFEGHAPTPEALDALAGLLAWRLDVGHLDPVSTVRFPSEGATYTLRAVSGHRDVNSTDCPGDLLWGELDGVAEATAGIGLPKLYEPHARRGPDGPVRFTARLSKPLDWTVTITGPNGETAEGSGKGPSVDWTWDTAGMPDGRYAFTISAGDDVRPATGGVRLGEAPDTEPEPPPPPPARPSGLPRRIPAWAWKLRTWHLAPKTTRGSRPAEAPRRVPPWYWAWFGWQSALKAWKTQYG